MTNIIIQNSLKKSIIATTLLLYACTTPETVLKNNETGQVTRCGGNVAYAGILYPFMAAADDRCVTEYKSQGFKDIREPAQAE